jgi:hypothetical protein
LPLMNRQQWQLGEHFVKAHASKVLRLRQLVSLKLTSPDCSPRHPL